MANGTSQDDRSLGQVISDLLEDVGNLFRQEIELAKAEIGQKVSRVTKDTVGVIVGGVIAYTGVIGLMFALILAIAVYLPLIASALIVGGVITLIGVLLLVKSIKDISSMEPAPTRTLRTVKEDVQYVKEKVSNG
jgi:hypothetical protein